MVMKWTSCCQRRRRTCRPKSPRVKTWRIAAMPWGLLECRRVSTTLSKEASGPSLSPFVSSFKINREVCWREVMHLEYLRQEEISPTIVESVVSPRSFLQMFFTCFFHPGRPREIFALFSHHPTETETVCTCYPATIACTFDFHNHSSLRQRSLFSSPLLPGPQEPVRCSSAVEYQPPRFAEGTPG